MPKVDQQKVIEGEVMDALSLQQQLNDTEQELMLDPRFKQFIQLREQVNNKWAEVRADIERVMVPAYKAGEIDKSIKGSWGSVTVTESDQFKIDEAALPAKFWLKKPNVAKIRATYQLEGKPPKGTEHYKRYGIMLKFKGEE